MPLVKGHPLSRPAFLAFATLSTATVGFLVKHWNYVTRREQRVIFRRYRDSFADYLSGEVSSGHFRSAKRDSLGVTRFGVGGRLSAASLRGSVFREGGCCLRA